MKQLNDINEYLDMNVRSSNEAFQNEMSTDENKDYRRGFRAGVLFAYLHMRSNIGSCDNAATEQPAN
jgi:hypothetical protein